MRTAYTVCRYVVAAVIFFYGFAKLTGAQFTVLDSELDKPLREVSGFWLTWYYYGYSAVYGTLVAGVQIVAGVLLLFRRTTLLGAAVLFAVISNIVLIDVFYGVDGGGLAAAVLLAGCLGFILLQHRHQLVGLFWEAPNPVYAAEPGGRARPALRAALVVGMLALAWGATSWIANSNNRLPTPLDGRWEVTSVEGGEADAPSTVYFERNRAFLCVFRYDGPEGTRWSRHHFEVEDGRLGIWSDWLTKGAPVFTGRYALDGDRLTVEGEWKGAPVALEFARRRT